MRVSYNWLKEFTPDLPAAKDVAHKLTMSGTEVESVTDLSAGITGVITAQVLKIEKHPNADKLSLCEVNTGAEVLSIVCGAKNMRPGDKVALALPGAELPGGVKIKKSKIRGVESGGMMCSEVELGLKDSSDGIMILPRDTPLGVDVMEHLGLKDFIMEVAVTPNRADLLSVRGVARELAAVLLARFTDKPVKVEETGPPICGLVTVTVEKGAPCPRYAARVIEGVAIGPAPEHIKRRLEACGIRPINNVVDVTNYVMLELGHPMHAFDLDRISGKKIAVRLSKAGESVVTIDGHTRVLDEGTPVIADAHGPVAIAGVMGGKDTEVTDATGSVLLECAYFEPSSVRRSSRKAGVSTDSSYRFERGVDIEGVIGAIDTAARMILEYAGGKAAKGAVDVYGSRYVPQTISLRIKRSEDLIGVALKEADISNILRGLGMIVREEGGGRLLVEPPSYRFDIRHEADLVEEIARIYGYDNIPVTSPVAELTPGTAARLGAIKRTVARVLANAGFFEAVNYAFISKDAFALAGSPDKASVVIKNPLSEDQAVMRCSIIPSLLDTLRKNLLVKNDFVRMFEIAPVFTAVAGEKLPRESWKVSGVMYGARHGESWCVAKETLDFFDIKGIVEKLLEGAGVAASPVFKALGDADTSRALFHPGKSSSVSVGGKRAGVLGEVAPDICDKFGLRAAAYVFELDMEAAYEGASEVRRYSPLPRFPESTRDIAFIVSDATPYAEIKVAIEALDTKLIENIELFDVYYGENIPGGSRSMALRLTYRSSEGTLKQEEVDSAHQRVCSELTSRFGAVIRGEDAR